MMRNLIPEASMRTTVTIDDELFEEAIALADPGMEKSQLFRESLKAFIRQQASRRLASLGGSIPEMELAPRRREGLEAP
jgi:Arc/MetJ family transcription regulator